MTTGTILDDADLRAIRDALGAGKQIKLLADGSVEVSPDPVASPMTPEAEAYIESQLGDVKAMVEQGFDLTLHPAGQVFGASADGLTRIQGDMDKALGSDDLLNLRVVLGMGANVAILTDGSIQTRHHLDQTPRTEQQVTDLMAAIDAKVADGGLVAEARAGRALTIADTGDGQGTQLRFADSRPDAPGIALPDDPVSPDPDASGGTTTTPPADIEIPEDPTGVDLADLADRIDEKSAALRTDALEDQVAESTRVGLLRDEAARDAWMNQQGHEAAWQQARRELKVVQEATKKVADLEAKAKAAEAGGKHSADHIEDLRQQAANHQARLDVARQRMESAQAEATRLGDTAAAQRNLVTAAEEQLAEITTRSEARIRFAETLETQAQQVRSAGESLAAGDAERARGWLSDARVVGAGEADPGDLVPDEPVESPGPITSPSQVEDGPITSPSQVDDVTGADQAPAPQAPADQPASEQPIEGQPGTDAPGTDQPAEQPAAEQPGAEQPGGEIEMPPDDLRVALQAADSVESDLQIELPEPSSDFADSGVDQSPAGDALVDAGADALDS